MPDHSTRPTTPRIAPLPPDERDDQARELLASAGTADGPTHNIFTTLVRHPGLFRRWLPFGGKLLAGKLPVRDRELLILRTGWRCQAEYEWGHHVLIGRAAGITDEEVRRIQVGADAPGWSALDATLLRAADELHDDSCISDTTWTELADHYDEAQLIEIPMLVGQYHLVSFSLNSLGVQREPDVPGFDG
jgi:4-carboxymuconolactone decarboxylase